MNSSNSNEICKFVAVAINYALCVMRYALFRKVMNTMGGALRTKSFAFAVRIVKLYKFLCATKKKFVLSKQLLRSGTAIGALVRESARAESKPDFVHKLGIALKEANETEYWISLLLETEYLKTAEAESMIVDNTELLKLLTSSINTAKLRMNGKQKTTSS